MRRCLMLLALLLCLPCVCLAAAEETPVLFVYDRADVLDADTEAYLTAMSEELMSRSGCRAVTVTVDFLDGKHISDVTENLFTGLGLTDDDVLTLLCVGEISTYAVCGKALRAVLPDARRDQLLGQYLVPQFSAGDNVGALRAYWPRLYDAVCVAKQIAPALTARPTQTPVPQTTVAPSSKLSWIVETDAPGATDDAHYDGDSWLDRLITLGMGGRVVEEKPVKESDEKGKSGFSFWKLIIILVILRIVFGNKKKWKGGSPYKRK